MIEFESGGNSLGTTPGIERIREHNYQGSGGGITHNRGFLHY